MLSLKPKELLIISNIKEADLVTHSGTFHSDEVFSTVILKNILDKEPIKICRISEIKEATDSFIYDIGLYGGISEVIILPSYSKFNFIFFNIDIYFF